MSTPHIEYCKKYYIKNRESILKRMSKNYSLNRESIRLSQNLRKRERYRNDSDFRNHTLEKCNEFRRKHKAYIRVKNAKQAKTDKQKARMKLQYAIRKGRIKRPTKCDSCSKKSKFIHGHHHNGYENAFDVIWLCSSCHGELHRIY